MGDGCLLHRHNRLVPLVRVPPHPPARGGTVDGSWLLCAMSAAAVWDLLERVEEHATAGGQPTARRVIGALPRHLWDQYPGDERVVAYTMWIRYGDTLLAGGLADEYRAWHPDGRPKLPDMPHHDDLTRVAAWPRRVRRRLAEL